jgi:MFS family permease
VISLTNAMTPLGLMIAGPLADKTGVNVMFIFASLVFVICGVFTLINPAVRNIENRQSKIALEQDSSVSAVGTTL